MIVEDVEDPFVATDNVMTVKIVIIVQAIVVVVHKCHHVEMVNVMALKIAVRVLKTVVHVK